MVRSSNPVALVTGAGSSGGIGFAIAKAMQAAGFRLCITSTTDRIFDRGGELGCLALTADLTQADQVTRLFARIAEELGPVEVLINNAGMVQTGHEVAETPLAGITDADWAHHMAVNINTTFHCCRTALPAMAQHGYGRIVNIASVTGPVVSLDGSAAYATAKAGITGLTRSIALEYAGQGITCNAILPGWIATESSTPLEIAAGAQTPTGRPGTPEEVAACAVFLASASASYVNGAMLVVDGGNTLQEVKG